MNPGYSHAAAGMSEAALRESDHRRARASESLTKQIGILLWKGRTCGLKSLTQLREDFQS
jgi:hypothetical protein